MVGDPTHERPGVAVGHVGIEVDAPGRAVLHPVSVVGVLVVGVLAAQLEPEHVGSLPVCRRLDCILGTRRFEERDKSEIVVGVLTRQHVKARGNRVLGVGRRESRDRVGVVVRVAVVVAVVDLKVQVFVGTQLVEQVETVRHVAGTGDTVRARRVVNGKRRVTVTPAVDRVVGIIRTDRIHLVEFVDTLQLEILLLVAKRRVRVVIRVRPTDRVRIVEIRAALVIALVVTVESL